MNDNMYDKIRGALYGVAVGDALGAPLEFMSREEIELRHGHVSEMIGGGWLNVKPGEVTDDTQMTICVAKGILKNPDYPFEEIGEEFIKWYYSRPKDIGGTCASSIYNAIKRGAKQACLQRPTKADWLEASIETDEQFHGRSGGNGSLMRTAYIGLYYADEGDVLMKALDVSKMTHRDEMAARACALYCRIIHKAIREGAIERRLDHFFAETVKVDYIRAYEPGFEPNPSGYSLDSLNAAVYCIKEAWESGGEFREAVETAVNLGGDADTVGAITGGLAGAIWGYEAIPTSWIEALSMKDRNTLDELAYVAARQQETGASETNNG